MNRRIARKIVRRVWSGYPTRRQWCLIRRAYNYLVGNRGRLGPFMAVRFTVGRFRWKKGGLK